MFIRRRGTSQIQPDKFEARPNYAELTIDDNTGVVLTTPTTATAVAGAPMANGEFFGAGVALAAGSITIDRAGRYRVGFHAGELVGVNSQALQLLVYKNAANLSPQIAAKITQPSTALPIVALSAEGILLLAKGDVLVLRAIGSTGNVTVKRLRFYAVQIDDVDQN